MQAPYFGIKAAEVKSKIGDLFEFLHLNNDGAKTRTQDSRCLIAPSPEVQPDFCAQKNVLILVFCDMRIRQLGQWKKRPGLIIGHGGRVDHCVRSR